MKYIDKVLSQLKGYKNTKEIEYELFDHLDEQEKFFIDIGYDEENAIEKAEEKMGDADILAEQFKEVEIAHEKNLFLGLINIAIILTVPYCFLISIFPNYFFGLFDTFAIVPLLITFVLFAIDVYFSIKHRSIWGIIISFFAGGFLIFDFIVSSNNATSVLSNQSPARLFFEYGYFAFFALAVIFAIAQISTIIIKIKTRLQRNRRFDLIFMRVMRIIVAVVSIISVMAITYFLPTLMTDVNKVRSELNEANHTAIQNIDTLVGCNYEEAKAWVEDTFPEYHFENEETVEYDSFPYEGYTETSCTFYSPNSHISIHIVGDEEGVSLHTVNECGYYTADPDYDLNIFKSEDIFYMQSSAENKANARDMNLPYELSIQNLDKPKKLDIRLYCNENDCNPYVLFFEYKNSELIATDFEHFEI